MPEPYPYNALVRVYSMMGRHQVYVHDLGQF